MAHGLGCLSPGAKGEVPGTRLRASSYEPGNRAGSATGSNFCFLFMSDTSARSTGMKFKKPNQMVKHKLVSFATVVALWTLVTLLIKLIRMLLKWKYIHGKNYANLVALMRKRSYFVKEVSSR